MRKSDFLINGGNLMKYILIFIILATISSCASKKKYLSQRENEFGTSGKHKWSFHRLSDRDKGTSLAFPGYIISIEKAYRKKIGAPSKKDLKNNYLQSIGFNESSSWDSLPRQKRNILSDGKPTFISSIISFSLDNKTIPVIKSESFYDAYDNSYLKDHSDAYNQGLKYLEKFGDKILKDIERNKITHVFIFSMGWNADQQEAIRNFNSLYGKIIANSNNSNKEFRPLFIGFTWDSKWPIPGVSIFNKTNDADEIGMIWANILLNKKLLNKDIKSPSFKTILIGHSLGAKLTSRMTMSASMLANNSRPVDLLINLESAYSINRYSLKQNGYEQAPDYMHWFDSLYVKNIALTCSKYDKANNIGKWAPYAGRYKTYTKVNKSYIEGDSSYVNIETFEYKKTSNIHFNKGKILFIDASSVIKMNAYHKGGFAHSDIYNDEVSEMLWKLIEAATFDY